MAKQRSTGGLPHGTKGTRRGATGNPAKGGTRTAPKQFFVKKKK